jgi:hypothetical protein
MSTFKELSRLINVKEICEPFFVELDSSDDLNNVWEQWTEQCFDNHIDPMEKIALIKQDQKAIGWLCFEDMLGNDTLKLVADCYEPISADKLISSDTPLLEAVSAVCSGTSYVYFVLSGNEFIGFLNYDHFNKLPFRLCLFALLIEIESLMMEIIRSDSTSFLKYLPEGRLASAKKIYKNRGFSIDNKGKEYDSNLLDCTTFIDKFKMMKKNQIITQKCPNIKSKFVNVANDLRNTVAHPEGEESMSLPIKREDFPSFLQWAEELQKQLQAMGLK